PPICPGVDQGTAEVADVRHVTVRQLVGGRGEPVPQAAVPDRPRDVRPRGGGALLALVLEGAPDQRGVQRVHVGARVGDDEVLATGLPDQPRIVPVEGDVLTDRPPQQLEGLRRPGEVDSGQVGMADRKSTRLNSSHVKSSYAAFGLKKKPCNSPGATT